MLLQHESSCFEYFGSFLMVVIVLVLLKKSEKKYNFITKVGYGLLYSVMFILVDDVM